jgi:DNA (cytosine-5)-methyltransferase 1
MRFGSVCSGIEAASVAWHPLGWRAAWLAEIEPFPSAVLKHHYPEVPNLGDMTTLPARIRAGEVEAPDLFCGGTPCQAFSVAGLRRSLDDARGNLSLTFCEIANAIDAVRRGRNDQPAIIFWENVPGVLSTGDNAFGCLLSGLAGEDEPLVAPGGKWTDAGCVLGPTRAVAWRILDAQYFGLAQRRRRVFVVASARDGFDPVAVLLEREGVRRDTAPRREAGQGAASTIDASFGRLQGCSGQDLNHGHSHLISMCLTSSSKSVERTGDTRGQTPVVQPVTYDFFNITAPVNRQSREPGDPCHTLARSNAEHAVVMQSVAVDTYNQTVTGDIAQTLCSRGDTPGGNAHLVPAIVAPTITATNDPSRSPQSSEVTQQVLAVMQATRPVAFDTYNQSVNPHTSQTIKSPQGAIQESVGTVLQAMQVRRLTPTECSRLQGFPDDYLELIYADADEAHAAQVLHELWKQVGASAFKKQEWRVGIPAALLTPEILLAGVYGGWIPWQMATECAAASRSVPSQNAYTEGFMCAMRIAWSSGYSPYQRQSFGQLAYELGSDLSILPLERTQARKALRSYKLWPQAQEKWPLRYAFAAPEKRDRLDRLSPDGPRYKALGNSWAVPVVRWIGQRIKNATA